MRTRPFVRLLLDDTAADGGGASEPTPAESTPAEDHVRLSRAEYEALRAGRDAAQTKAKTTEERLAQIEARYRAEAQRNALSTALERVAGGRLHDGAADAARRLLGPDIEIRDDGSAVHLPTGKRVEELTLEDVQATGIGFLIQPNGGGTGKLGGNRVIDGAAGHHPTPGHALLEQFARNAPRRPASLGGDCAAD